MNEYNEDIETEEVVTTKKKGRKRKKKAKANSSSRVWVSVMNGDFLSKPFLVQQMPFILFLGGIAISYIAYGYYAQHLAQQAIDLQEEESNLNATIVTLRSEMNQRSQQGDVAVELSESGLKETTTPPKKILIEEPEDEN